jgi:hypothetical protein
MIVICAWCEKEGIPSLLSVWPPIDDGRVSHGICKTHVASYLEALSSRPLPSIARQETTNIDENRGRLASKPSPRRQRSSQSRAGGT